MIRLPHSISAKVVTPRVFEPIGSLAPRILSVFSGVGQGVGYAWPAGVLATPSHPASTTISKHGMILHMQRPIRKEPGNEGTPFTRCLRGTEHVFQSALALTLILPQYPRRPCAD